MEYAHTIAKDEELLTVSSGNLAQQRQQVVRNTLRVLTHDSARVGTTRVEVSEQCTIPLLEWLSGLLQIASLSVDKVGDDVLNHGLGATIGVGRTNGAVLWDGNHVGESGGITVDGGRRREDNVGDIVALHGAEQGNAAANIDAVVLERNFARLANSLCGDQSRLR